MPDKLPFTDDDDDDTNREKPDYGESADLSEIESLTQDPYSSPTDPSLSESVDTAQSGFPSQAWTTLNNCLSMTKWVVPVLPDSQLETLLKASIELAKLGKDTDCSMCKDFYSFGLLTSFYKTFQDGAVDGWDCQILHYIYMNALLAIELCAIKAADDCLPILELQSILFSPDSRFQQHSMYPTNICWKIQHGEKTNGTLRYTHLTPLLPHLLAKTPGELATFAPLNSESSRLKAYFSSQSRRHLIPILSDFINLFGRLGGFDRLLSRFTRFAELDHFPASLVAAYLHPFSRCCDYLHSGVLQTYFVPIVDIVVPRFSKLIETNSTGNHKSDLKSDSFAELSFNLRCLLLRMPERKNLLEQLDMFCLNLILRHLQYASFNKRMTALNDLNSLFLRLSPSDVCYAPLVQTPIVDPLTIEHVANWMHEKQVLTLILRENLHQPQYVERVERIIRFMIKLKYLTEDDLGRIWESQDGKHEAISKNVFDMLARLALEFTPDQLDYLFRRVQVIDQSLCKLYASTSTVRFIEIPFSEYSSSFRVYRLYSPLFQVSYIFLSTRSIVRPFAIVFTVSD
ncbi:unnamed protein product [Dicrocoelium dendriticum]|nr:unnamed protein product [Dicrocoelium dendriticum]